MSLVVLGGGVSPFVRKVRVFLAEKGLDYSHEEVNPFAPPEGWREVSPLGRIPAFRDGERVISGRSTSGRKTFGPETGTMPPSMYSSIQSARANSWSSFG